MQGAALSRRPLFLRPTRSRAGFIPAGVSLSTARRVLWIVAGTFGGLWGLTVFWLRLTGSYPQVFLVAGLGVGLMNLIAHYWTRPEPEDRE